MSDQQKYRYPGEHIDVEWDERLCIHIGECGQSEGELFVGGRQPWCEPDLTSIEFVKEVVERCPSGALTYQVKDGHSSERAASENTVTVSCNGPYFAKGNLTLVTGSGRKVWQGNNVALCRCGASGNKPFCDGSHKQAGFKGT